MTITINTILHYIYWGFIGFVVGLEYDATTWQFYAILIPLAALHTFTYRKHCN